MSVWPITRGPAFHSYADTRSWLGIPNTLDVVSNVAFVIAALWMWRRTRGLARLACAGTAAIGIGSALYHWSPSDTTLAFDWAPIATTLMWVLATVVEDRGGPGRAVAIGGALAAIGSVVYWLATGGTHGGDMTAYVVVQGAGVALPPLVALFRQGRIPALQLVLALGCFGLARLAAAHDRDLLDAIGISGHSLKHVIAALAAAIVLRAMRR
ncbi:MAG TPA: hypothetical protein VMZ53_19780 [Kofleriaceae bacterium]|nr:hypothetical protein [Kofleriaceae bacterium]